MKPDAARASAGMSAATWGMLGLLSLLWGGSFFFTGLAVRELQPFTVVLLRVGFAALALLAMAAWSGLRPPAEARVIGAFFVMALLNIVIPFTLIVWGQTQIPSGLASILNATTPLFAVLVAHVATRDEKLTGPKAAGVLAGFLGVVTLVGPAALGHAEAGVLAHLAGVGAALSYAVAGVYGRRFVRRGVPTLTSATATTVAATAMMAPLAFAFERPIAAAAQASAVTWGSIAGLSLLSTAAGYLLYYRILARAGATNLMLVTFLMPVTAILLGWALLGEQLRPAHLLGMALIGVGLALIDGRVLRRR
ncbi:MAG TPA: DMT family transporter [Beijerinckiaceae bacterium]|jgi:drug/metabolite transporter (DMT)-like permease